VTLRRAAYSTNIKTRLDFSCALFDGRARSVAQAFAQPIHLGTLATFVPAILEKYGAPFEAGDALLCNEGHLGGLHLNDVCLLAPLVIDGRPFAYAVSMAHHVDVGGGIDDVDVAEDAAFFDYQRRSATAALGIEVGPGRRASLGYSFEEVPGTAERPEAESRVHALSAGIDGQIMSLLSGRASVGYTRRESPQAAPGGQTFTGLSFGAQLKREFGRSSSLVLSADRGTELSNFEENAFYVMTSVQATLSVPLPFSFSGIVGGGYHVNDYLTTASALGEPRRDEIVGWLAGVGRSVTRWAFVRADYRQDRRNSNIDAFDQSPHAFYVQVGLGYVGSPGGR
jgi:hypothetical protein